MNCNLKLNSRRCRSLVGWLVFSYLLIPLHRTMSKDPTSDSRVPGLEVHWDSSQGKLSRNQNPYPAELSPSDHQLFLEGVRCSKTGWHPCGEGDRVATPYPGVRIYS
jgi:hypothetical protein